MTGTEIRAIAGILFVIVLGLLAVSYTHLGFVLPERWSAFFLPGCWSQSCLSSLSF